MSTQKKCLGSGILFTDFYQFTMAQLYFRFGLHEKKALFDYFFRSYPDYGSHKAGYCVFAGLQTVADWISSLTVDLATFIPLRLHRSSSGKSLFSDDFINWLAQDVSFNSLTIRSVDEGRVVHPQEPIVTVNGPLAVAQILESSLLNTLNYQTLIATKACRIREAGLRQPVLEFGLRRAAHAGADAGTRAALIGGADFSSNSGISYQLNLPPKGTHAHSMVQLFIAMGEGEIGAFKAYASVYPDDCLLLVDTVNTLESGVPNAIKVFENLRSKGHRPIGIRLDSGDLAYLCVKARQMLDSAGFPDTIIVLSNNIDEMVLMQILEQIHYEAQRYGMDTDHIIKKLVYGVGTRLITSQGCSALDGVYKLTGIQKDQTWIPAIKISDTPEKTHLPGPKQVWRLYDKSNIATADLIAIEKEDPFIVSPFMLHHPIQTLINRTLEAKYLSKKEPLLKDILLEGKLVYDFPDIGSLRINRDLDLDRLDPGVKRLINPHIYHVSLTDDLWKLKQALIRDHTVYPEP